MRVGLIGAGKFAAMYLAQVPQDAGRASGRDRRPRAGECAHESGARRLEGRRYAAASLDAALASGTHAHRRRLGAARLASADRHRHRGDRQSGRRGGPCAGRIPQRQARSHGHGRGRRVLRPDARDASARGGRGLQPRVRRPARDDLRPGRLGARGGLPGGRGGPRPQVAAAFRAVDARDGVGLLRAHARAGEGRRAESEDVQLVSRRLEAGDRDHRGVQRHRPHAGARRACVIRPRASTRFPT